MSPGCAASAGLDPLLPVLGDVCSPGRLVNPWCRGREAGADAGVPGPGWGATWRVSSWPHLHVTRSSRQSLSWGCHPRSSWAGVMITPGAEPQPQVDTTSRSFVWVTGGLCGQLPVDVTVATTGRPDSQAQKAGLWSVSPRGRPGRGACLLED